MTPSTISAPSGSLWSSWRRSGLADAIAAHPFPEHPPDDAADAFRRALAQLRGGGGAT